MNPKIKAVLLVGASTLMIFTLYRYSNKRKKKSNSAMCSGFVKTFFSNFTKIYQKKNCSSQANLTKLLNIEFSNVHIKNKQAVNKKLSNIIQDGVNHFLILTDFDGTLTKFSEKGVRLQSTHGMLEAYPGFSKDDVKFFKDVTAKYYPIEIDPNLTDQEKLGYMEDWWNSTHERCIRAGIKEHLLEETVQKAVVPFRDGWQELFDFVVANNVPCLIFSAGVGNVIKIMLKLYKINTPLVNIVSNFMEFDSEGQLYQFSSPLIHTFSKRASVVLDTNPKLLDRKNVLLIGDSTGDLNMAKGYPTENLISVGFLNDRVEERLPFYLNNYDIVCVEDESLFVPLLILRAIVES